MPVFETVKVAAIQAAPVILDADATIDKALGLLHRAADDGVQLAVFPETFVSVYPSGAWGHQAAQFGGFDEMWERLWASSIEVPGPAVDKLVAACAERDILCAIGINEREIERPGSLYNSMLLLGPDGLLIKHRKLVPTMHERLFHGPGDGTDLDVAKTKLGRIGGLICWENRMPFATSCTAKACRYGWRRLQTIRMVGWQACDTSLSSRVLSLSAFLNTSIERPSRLTSRCPSQTIRSSDVVAPRSSSLVEARSSQAPSTTKKG
jgi:predicted amidohydrolase